MIDDMGSFRTTMEITPSDAPHRRVRIDDVMVDTGAEYSWAPSQVLTDIRVVRARIERLEAAEGSILERGVGFVMLYAGGRSSPSIVVFGDAGDMTLLGAFAVEVLNLRV